MRRLSLCLVVAAGSLILARGALADGPPIPVDQGGTGVATSVPPRSHYVTVPDGSRTLLELLQHGAVTNWRSLPGSWGIPTVGYLGQGLSGDGSTLVLAAPVPPYARPSFFLLVNAQRMSVVRRITLRGSFSYDAISPDGSRLYFIQYTNVSDLGHYVVRAYDVRTRRLLPGKIADRAETEKSMYGYPQSRVTSANGRWDYTLYTKQMGGSFIHALDTARGVAHCIDLPANQHVYSVTLSLRNGGHTIAADLPHGRRWLNISTGSWRVSRPSPVSPHATAFPWAWIGAAVGGGLALLAAAALILRRRRREELEERPRQELGLA